MPSPGRIPSRANTGYQYPAGGTCRCPRSSPRHAVLHVQRRPRAASTTSALPRQRPDGRAYLDGLPGPLTSGGCGGIMPTPPGCCRYGWRCWQAVCWPVAGEPARGGTSRDRGGARTLLNHALPRCRRGPGRRVGPVRADDGRCAGPVSSHRWCPVARVGRRLAEIDAARSRSWPPIGRHHRGHIDRLRRVYGRTAPCCVTRPAGDSG